jgi:hypothetical protein
MGRDNLPEIEVAGVLYLFPDTNLFFQCRPLEQLGWGLWKDFDEVHLIVSRPVQVEVDDHKGKGSNRRSDRARKASRLFRDIITSAYKHQTIRAAAPLVKLFVQLQIEPSDEILKLNYNRSDHQLIGIAHAFAMQNAGADVRVLTDDGGVLATADMVGFPYVEIPPDWLLPPETSDGQKRITALQKEVDRLKAAEPKVHIQCLDMSRSPVETLEIKHPLYRPLNGDQVADLMERLRQDCAVATDFGSADDPVHPLLGTRGAGALLTMRWGQAWLPASEVEIADYRDTKYPNWLNDCQAMLGNLHELLNADVGSPTVWFSIENKGTRPGKDVLVTLSASGNFLIMPTKRIDPDDEEKPRAKVVALPAPPAPPHGKWVINQPYAGFLNHPGLLEAAGRSSLGYRTGVMDAALGGLPRIELPDPNRFYFRPHRPKEPVVSFSRECEQWRHSMPAEEFGLEIRFDQDADSIAGLLECRVHAENLTDPSTMSVPVQIAIEEADTHERAVKLVERRIRNALADSLFERRRRGN